VTTIRQLRLFRSYSAREQEQSVGFEIAVNPHKLNGKENKRTGHRNFEKQDISCKVVRCAGYALEMGPSCSFVKTCGRVDI
jgi:hypothetical protein